MDVLVAMRLDTFMEDCPNNPTNKKKGRRKKDKPSQSKPWDDTSSKEET